MNARSVAQHYRNHKTLRSVPNDFQHRNFCCCPRPAYPLVGVEIQLSLDRESEESFFQYTYWSTSIFFNKRENVQYKKSIVRVVLLSAVTKTYIGRPGDSLCWISHVAWSMIIEVAVWRNYNLTKYFLYMKPCKYLMFETPLPGTQLGHFPIVCIGQELARNWGKCGESFHMHMALIPQGKLVCRQHCLPPAPKHLQVPVQNYESMNIGLLCNGIPPQLQRNANIEHSSTRRASGNRGGKLGDVSPTCHCLH